MVSQSSRQRLTQTQRSDATRARLIQATIDCIAEHGYGSASTADIHRRAGVSSGARVHHFQTKLDLVAAAVRTLYEDAASASVEAAGRPGSLADPVAGFLADAYRFYSGPRYLAQHELVNAARTSAELSAIIRPAADRYRARVDEAWLGTFQAAGHSAEWSRQTMTLTVVMVRGLALGSFLRGRDQDEDLLRRWAAVMARTREA